MIEKFSRIKGVGVFDDFSWNSSVRARNGVVLNFKKINIIYGRNYSGKTTLSRVVRGLDIGTLPEEFDSPEIEIVFSDGTAVTNLNLSEHQHGVRVFNDDFVRQHLKFIFDPEEDVEAFAILGKDNNLIESEIEMLSNELGSNEEGSETGLYKSLKRASDDLRSEETKLKDVEEALSGRIRQKAIDRRVGIKYRSDRFGDQNYTTGKLQTELDFVTGKEYSVPTNDKLARAEKLLGETTKAEIPRFMFPQLRFAAIEATARRLLTKKITESERIEELLVDATLHRWVNEGRSLHRDKREKCAFCGNPISEDRWRQLENHFDEESEELENEINDALKLVDDESTKLSNAFAFELADFYSIFHDRLRNLNGQFKEVSGQYIASLELLGDQLKSRLDAILLPREIDPPLDVSPRLLELFDALEKNRIESNQYSANLKKDQTDAREALRLKEVFDFSETVGYSAETEKIKKLRESVGRKKDHRDSVLASIRQKESLIDSKRRQLNDEEEGARKVNELLRQYFGHDSISLEAIETPLDESQEEKQVRFEIKRYGKKAHHLSEGECSLIAFCYFMARLQDSDTLGQKPIIWIDDPISSLDNNHVFFLFSIIRSQIVDADAFEQLFVSTHSLEFLKYLKRLGESHDRRYLLVQRNDRFAELRRMPKYLKEFVTEFNYLFSQINQCANIDEITDKNYTTFYSFGNNARKFLEIYLYYRFPDAPYGLDKLKRFFGDKPIPAVLTDRINNEYSHLAASFERGAIPVDAPEMKSAAKLIIERIKEIDRQQYDALIRSLAEN